jgi:hypothetical protein
VTSLILNDIYIEYFKRRTRTKASIRYAKRMIERREREGEREREREKGRRRDIESEGEIRERER